MRATAKTAAKAAIIDNSQLSAMNSPTTGISLTIGSSCGAKIKATIPAAIQPAMASDSRTKPRE